MWFLNVSVPPEAVDAVLLVTVLVSFVFSVVRKVVSAVVVRLSFANVLVESRVEVFVAVTSSVTEPFVVV